MPAPNTDATRALLASLWERNLPTLRDRVAELEAATAAAKQGTLTPEARESACNTAHKLAGSLGMFGYAESTDAARVIDQLLDGDEPLDAEELEAEVGALRATLPL